MAIEKSLYQAPEGLDSLMNEEPDIQIEIEDPEDVSLTIGDMTLEIGRAHV